MYSFISCVCVFALDANATGNGQRKQHSQSSVIHRNRKWKWMRERPRHTAPTVVLLLFRLIDATQYSYEFRAVIDARCSVGGDVSTHKSSNQLGNSAPNRTETTAQKMPRKSTSSPSGVYCIQSNMYWMYGQECKRDDWTRYNINTVNTKHFHSQDFSRTLTHAPCYICAQTHETKWKISKEKKKKKKNDMNWIKPISLNSQYFLCYVRIEIATWTKIMVHDVC